jgi:hypothetical protein
MQRALRRLRAEADERTTPVLKIDVHKVLQEQLRELTQRSVAALPHLMARPTDRQAYAALWDEPKWNRRMREAMAPSLTRMAEGVDAGLRQLLGRTAGKAQSTAAAGAVTRALTSAGTRITGLNARTRDSVLATVRRVVSHAVHDGLGVAEAGDLLEEEINAAALVNGTSVWDELRAETVARTEMMTAYNDAALGSYADMDVTEVQAIDGDEDPECEERDGEVFSMEEAATIEDHPNGTLDWIPIVPEAPEEEA